MKRHRIRFFLDYGTCFWGAYGEGDFFGALEPEDLLLSPQTQNEVTKFLKAYDQYYGWGCPPSLGWTVEDCKQFNREYRRIFKLILLELDSQFLICNEQFELIEDPELLEEYYRQGHDFVRERMVEA